MGFFGKYYTKSVKIHTKGVKFHAKGVKTCLNWRKNFEKKVLHFIFCCYQFVHTKSVNKVVYNNKEAAALEGAIHYLPVKFAHAIIVREDNHNS